MIARSIQLGLAGALGAVLALAPAGVGGAEPELPGVVVYKSATCGCCGKWAEHLRAAGFRVTLRDVGSVPAVEERYGVPKGLGSCHTALVGGYVVVGHVPADVVKKMLAERPAIAGISVPGMPQSAPGMDMPTPDHYDVVAWDKDGKTRVYAQR